jgi:hypothetical protein
VLQLSVCFGLVGCDTTGDGAEMLSLFSPDVEVTGFCPCVDDREIEGFVEALIGDVFVEGNASVLVTNGVDSATSPGFEAVFDGDSFFLTFSFETIFSLFVLFVLVFGAILLPFLFL